MQVPTTQKGTDICGNSLKEYHGSQNDYQNNSKIILICNRTNKKLPGRKSCSGLVTGNFENSKLFEGLVILNKKRKTRQPQSYLSSVPFHLVSPLLFSRLSSCLPSSLVLSSLVPRVLPSLVFSVSVCLSPCVVVCCSVLLCVVVVWCVVCGVCGGVWCGTLEKTCVH